MVSSITLTRIRVANLSLTWDEIFMDKIGVKVGKVVGLCNAFCRAPISAMFSRENISLMQETH